MQGGQPIQGISVFRPDEYRLSPQWKVEVVSSCLQKYRMVVDPLSRHIHANLKSASMELILWEIDE